MASAVEATKNVASAPYAHEHCTGWQETMSQKQSGRAVDMQDWQKGHAESHAGMPRFAKTVGVSRPPPWTQMLHPRPRTALRA